MLKFLKQNWFKIILAFCAVAVAVGYLWGVGIEQHKENRLTPNGIKIDVNKLKLNR